MRKWLRKAVGLRKSRKGQTTAEYAIIVALVAVSSIAIILIFGDQIRNIFGASTEQLAGDSSATVEAETVDDDALDGSLDNF